MKTFKTLKDLQQLHPIDPAYSVIRERISALPGYVVLIEEEDIIRPINLPELKGHLKDFHWDGVSREYGYFHAVYLTNNEFALEFIIPDAPWLDADIKANLERHLH